MLGLSICARFSAKTNGLIVAEGICVAEANVTRNYRSRLCIWNCVMSLKREIWQSSPHELMAYMCEHQLINMYYSACFLQ